MRLSTPALALAALAAAAPTYPEIAASPAQARSIQVMSDYYNLLAAKVAAYKSDSDAQPTCDLSGAKMPSSSLPPPDTGLTLSHVALGRGIQNYTCSPGNATAAPVSTGAVATLFNASCIAAAHPDLLALLPPVALQYGLGTSQSSGSPIAGPTEMHVSGSHFFTSAGAPFFDMRAVSSSPLGETACARLNASAAPAGAMVGPAGEPAVPWLRLRATSHPAGPSTVREVYRLSTAGGSAPPTCEGADETISVEYSALYWFFSE